MHGGRRTLSQADTPDESEQESQSREWTDEEISTAEKLAELYQDHPEGDVFETIAQSASESKEETAR